MIILATIYSYYPYVQKSLIGEPEQANMPGFN